MTRFLNNKEVDLLLDFSLSSESEWNIMVCTLDDILYNKINELLSDEKIKLQREFSGCDTIVMCVKNIPDLLIIDEEINDIPAEKIIKCLKKYDGLNKIKILCSLKDAKKNEISDYGADDYFVKYNLDKVYLYKKVNSLLYVSEPVSKSTKMKFKERRWPRTVINITAKIEVVNEENPEKVVEGEATVVDISRNGAFLSDIKFKSGEKFDKSFKLRLKINQPPLKHLNAESVIVWCKSDESSGVKFTEISKKDQLKIESLFNE